MCCHQIFGYTHPRLLTLLILGFDNNGHDHDDQFGEIYPSMSLTVHLALVFHVFVAVAVIVMVSGRHGIGL